MENETLDAYFKRLVDLFYNYYQSKYEAYMKNANNKSHIFLRIYSLSELIPSHLFLNREAAVILSFIEDPYIHGGITMDAILYFLRKENPENLKLSNKINLLYIAWNKDYLNTDSGSELEKGVVDLNKYSDQIIVKDFAKFKTWQKMHLFLENERKFFLNDKNQEHTELEMTSIREKENKEVFIGSSKNEPEAETKYPEFTIARRVLAMRYIFKGLGIEVEEGNYSAVARFIQFMTGNDYTSIYKKVCSPLKEGKKGNEDLRYVRERFEDMNYLKFEELILKDRKT
jgi:hypothetical protein